VILDKTHKNNRFFCCYQHIWYQRISIISKSFAIAIWTSLDF